MTRQEMLNLLGLSSNYTESELKKAYNKAAKENHPDLNPGDKEKEERFKDISDAYENLKKKFESNRKQNTPTPDLDDLQLDYINKIRAYFTNLQDYLNQPDFKGIIEVLTEYKNLVILSIEISFKTSTVKQFYDNFLKSYAHELEQFMKDYYKNNYINGEEVTETVDCNTSLKIFFDKLVSIKKKYSREEQYIARIKESVSVYINDTKYDPIKNQINIRLNQALVSAKAGKYQRLDSLIVNLVADIEVIISRYETFNQKINGIYEELKALYGIDILEVIEDARYNEDLRESLKIIRGISETEISIVLDIMLGFQNSEYVSAEVLGKLENLINNKKYFKQNEAAICEINQRIFALFSNSLLGKNAEEQQGIIEIYNRYLEFYKLTLKGEISLDNFKKLECLTFADVEKDNQLFYSLGNVNINQSDKNIEINKLYVKKSNRLDKYHSPYSEFCFLIDYEGLFMLNLLNDGGLGGCRVTEEEISENYVTYEEFMKDMKFDGRVSSYWLKPYTICYVNSSEEYGIVINNGYIFIDSMFYYDHRYYTSEFAQFILPFEDKALLERTLRDMFIMRLEGLESKNIDACFKDKNNLIYKIDNKEYLKM